MGGRTDLNLRMDDTTTQANFQLCWSKTVEHLTRQDSESEVELFKKDIRTITFRDTHQIIDIFVICLYSVLVATETI